MLAHQILAPLAHELCDLLPDRPSVREDEVLYIRAALIGRFHDAEDPRPVPPAGTEVRVDRVAAEVGVDSEGIGKGLVPVRRLQKRRRISPGRRADVAAL